MIAKEESHEPNCGSKTFRGGLCAVSIVTGIIMLGVSMGMGACTCESAEALKDGRFAAWCGVGKGNYEKANYATSVAWAGACLVWFGTRWSLTLLLALSVNEAGLISCDRGRQQTECISSSSLMS